MDTALSMFPRVFNGVRTGAEQATFLKTCGFEFGDMLIRKNFTVSEDSPESDFEELFRQYKAVGVALYSAITDLNTPSEKMKEILSICSRHNLWIVKIGQYVYRDGSFRAIAGQARKDLERLAVLSKKYGVQILVENHGGTINSSPSLCR
jgi:sugar phosphate isomerase/epimerase